MTGLVISTNIQSKNMCEFVNFVKGKILFVNFSLTYDNNKKCTVFKMLRKKILTTLNQLIEQIHEKQSCQRSWLDSQNSASIDLDHYFRSIGPKIPSKC